jgi:hypothetical protein
VTGVISTRPIRKAEYHYDDSPELRMQVLGFHDFQKVFSEDQGVLIRPDAIWSREVAWCSCGNAAIFTDMYTYTGWTVPCTRCGDQLQLRRL